MQDFTFKHSEQVDAIYTQYTAQQIKALFDSRGEELRIALNLLVSSLNSTEGASNIGTNTVQDLDGATLQEMLKSIRDKLKSKVDGSSGADFVHATSIEGLAGESVQAILEALKGLVDNNKSTLETSIDSVQTNLDSKINTSIAGVKASSISADPIALGSGNTVQAQLAWLLSQIAVAATGSIPDGTLTEAKLAQALIDKINKSLSNIGVLTTLGTEDKTSLVNALNEVYTTTTTHMANDVAHNRYGTASGANAKTITLNPAPTSLGGGFSLRFKNTTANTGAVTLNINGLGAKPIIKNGGLALSSGNLKVGGIYTVVYDGTDFILQGERGEYGTATPVDVLKGKTFGTENGIMTGTFDHFPVTPGDLVIYQDTATSDTIQMTYTKVKAVTVNTEGVYRIAFTIKTNSTARTAYGQIYKNGVPYGTERTTASTTGTTFTEDLYFDIGDEIQLYLKHSHATTASLSNFILSIFNVVGITKVL